MAVDLKPQAEGKIISVYVSGKLSKEDYQRLSPEFERAIQTHGKIRVLFDMHDFHGWEVGALWEDIKIDLKHFSHIERLAMVGESRWEKGMSIFCKPFTTAKVRYFDRAQAEEAKAWIEGE